jgi:hypothetical protein
VSGTFSLGILSGTFSLSEGQQHAAERPLLDQMPPGTRMLEWPDATSRRVRKSAAKCNMTKSGPR